MAMVVKENRKAQRAQGTAAILAIGTANPENCLNQAEYPDYYFRVTNTDHMADWKMKFHRICKKSMIRKRHMHLSEEILKANPNICAHMAPSLEARQDIEIIETPKLGEKAASMALKYWGQPKSSITHLLFCTTSGGDLLSADYQLTKLLGLNPSIKRFMMNGYGCFAGGTVLRLAKDLAENNAGARVLVVCSEVLVTSFRGPSSTSWDSLVAPAIFGDGASAVIIGADPDTATERPLFEIVSANQTIVPGTEGIIEGHLRERK